MERGIKTQISRKLYKEVKKEQLRLMCIEARKRNKRKRITMIMASSSLVRKLK